MKNTAFEALPAYAVLALVRMREAEEAAREHRLANRLAASRRWTRLARYAARRAERIEISRR